MRENTGEINHIKETTMRPFFCRQGSKRKYSKALVSLFPEHQVYVEPFLGGGAVFWEKKPSEKEVINDLDSKLMADYNLLLTAPSNPNAYSILTTESAQNNFLRTTHKGKADKLLESLLRRCNGYGGTYIEKGSKQGVYTDERAHRVSKVTTHEDKLKNISSYQKRLGHATLTNKPYDAVLRDYDGANTFIFLDPPYEKSVGLDYAKGSDAFNFPKFAEDLRRVKGKFLVTINDSRNIRKLFKGFKLYPYVVKGHHAKSAIGKEDRKELLITNYNLPRMWKSRMTKGVLQGGSYYVGGMDKDEEGYESDVESNKDVGDCCQFAFERLNEIGYELPSIWKYIEEWDGVDDDELKEEFKQAKVLFKYFGTSTTDPMNPKQVMNIFKQGAELGNSFLVSTYHPVSDNSHISAVTNDDGRLWWHEEDKSSKGEKDELFEIELNKPIDQQDVFHEVLGSRAYITSMFMFLPIGTHMKEDEEEEEKEEKEEKEKDMEEEEEIDSGYEGDEDLKGRGRGDMNANEIYDEARDIIDRKYAQFQSGCAVFGLICLQRYLNVPINIRRVLRIADAQPNKGDLEDQHITDVLEAAEVTMEEVAPTGNNQFLTEAEMDAVYERIEDEGICAIVLTQQDPQGNPDEGHATCYLPQRRTAAEIAAGADGPYAPMYFDCQVNHPQAQVVPLNVVGVWFITDAPAELPEEEEEEEEEEGEGEMEGTGLKGKGVGDMDADALWMEARRIIDEKYAAYNSGCAVFGLVCLQRYLNKPINIRLAMRMADKKRRKGGLDDSEIAVLLADANLDVVSHQPGPDPETGVIPQFIPQNTINTAQDYVANRGYCVLFKMRLNNGDAHLSSMFPRKRPAAQVAAGGTPYVPVLMDCLLGEPQPNAIPVNVEFAWGIKDEPVEMKGGTLGKDGIPNMFESINEILHKKGPTMYSEFKNLVETTLNNLSQKEAKAVGEKTLLEIAKALEDFVGDEEELERYKKLGELEMLLNDVHDSVLLSTYGVRAVEKSLKFIKKKFGKGTHKQNVEKKLGLKPNGHSLPELAKASGVKLSTLQNVFNRGIGAHRTQPLSVRMKDTLKKNVKAPMSKKMSKEQWAQSRVYSFLDGNPKHDQDLRGGAGPRLIHTLVNRFQLGKEHLPELQRREELDALTYALMNGNQTRFPTTLEEMTHVYWGENSCMTFAVHVLEGAMDNMLDIGTLALLNAQNSEMGLSANDVVGFLQGEGINAEVREEETKSILQAVAEGRNGIITLVDDEGEQHAIAFVRTNRGYYTIECGEDPKPLRIADWKEKGQNVVEVVVLPGLEGGGWTGMTEKKYLAIARRKAKKHGYDPSALDFAKDGEHKLKLHTPDGRTIKFGRVGYGDFILWTYKEKRGEAPPGTSKMKRRVFRKSHSAMKGDWRTDKFSPNNLALAILW